MELMQRLERLSFPVKALLIGVSFFLIAGVFSVTINPLEFFRFQVDRQRNKDLKFLSQLISFIDEQAQYALLGERRLVYVSLPDDDPTCGYWRDRGLLQLAEGYDYRCVPKERLTQIDGSGWLPIDFRQIPGIQIDALPIDPQNGKNGINPDTNEDTLFFYHYTFGSYSVGVRFASLQANAAAAESFEQWVVSWIEQKLGWKRGFASNKNNEMGRLTAQANGALGKEDQVQKQCQY